MHLTPDLSKVHQTSSWNKSKAAEKNVETEFIDSQLPPEENMMDTLAKLISDHKMLFEQYTNYTKEADKIFAKYVFIKMIIFKFGVIYCYRF